jgi:heme A synthase
MPDPCNPVPRWLRVLAVVTALLTLPLVTLGAEVTTKRVGMVDKVGLRKPWHFVEYVVKTPREELSLAYLIEHGHRQVGFLVGLCCIVLAVGLLVTTRSWFYRSLGLLALAAVSAQGVLGIFRVNWDVWAGPELAAVHGACAQLAFATLVAVAVLLSRTWATPPAAAPVGRNASLALAVLLFAQIAFGAVTRHLTDTLAQRLHVALAFAVLVVAALLIYRLWESAADRAAMRFALLLAALLVIQPLLGIEAWMRRFGPDRPMDLLPEMVPSSPALDVVRSAHHVVGTLIFAAAVGLAVMLRRPAAEAAPQAAPAPSLEGAA